MNSPSLKEGSREIAFLLGISHDSFYELQRRLVAQGYLQAREGRGPGSGVECSARNLAILLTEYFTSQPASVLVNAAAHFKSHQANSSSATREVVARNITDETLLSSLELSPRTIKTLRRENISTVADLRAYVEMPTRFGCLNPEAKLLGIPGFGRLSLNQLKDNGLL